MPAPFATLSAATLNDGDNEGCNDDRGVLFACIDALSFGESDGCCDARIARIEALSVGESDRCCEADVLACDLLFKNRCPGDPAGALGDEEGSSKGHVLPLLIRHGGSVCSDMDNTKALPAFSLKA